MTKIWREGRIVVPLRKMIKLCVHLCLGKDTSISTPTLPSRSSGTEANKDLLISFLNAMFDGREVIRDLRYLNVEHLGHIVEDRKAVFKDMSPTGVLLRESQDYVPEDVELANVRLQRSFRKGTWNTIVLPCAVPNPDEVFGTGTQLARLSEFTDNVMKFETVETMEANIPYLIKPGSITNSALSNGQTKLAIYDIYGTTVEEPGEDGPIDVVNEGEISFVGSYVSSAVSAGNGNYYISSDMLYYVDAGATVNSGRFRGYFHVDQSGLAKRISIFIGDNEDGLIDIIVPVTADIYRLDGTMVRKSGTDTHGLAPGLYIMGGNKIIVK